MFAAADDQPCTAYDTNGKFYDLNSLAANPARTIISKLSAVTSSTLMFADLYEQILGSSRTLLKSVDL